MSILSAKPRELSELLTASFELYTKSFTRIIGYALLAFVTNQLLTEFMLNAMPEAFNPNVIPDQQVEIISQAMPSLMLALIISAVASCVFYGASIYRIDNLVKGKNDDFSGAMLFAVSKIPSMLLAGFLYMLVTIAGLFLFVVPGFIVMISLVFCWYFILLENKTAIDALTSSHNLVWGDWWRTNWVFFVPVLVMFVLFFIIGAVAAFVLDPTSQAFSIVSGLLGTIVAPYFYGIAYLQYHDLKLRKSM